MNAEQRLLDAGYEDILYFVNPSYDDALIGVTALDNRAVYDYEKMIYHLIKEEDMSWEEAAEFIDCNTLSAYFGEGTPIIIFGV